MQFIFQCTTVLFKADWIFQNKVHSSHPNLVLAEFLGQDIYFKAVCQFATCVKNLGKNEVNIIFILYS